MLSFENDLRVLSDRFDKWAELNEGKLTDVKLFLSESVNSGQNDSLTVLGIIKEGETPSFIYLVKKGTCGIYNNIQLK